MSFSIIIFHDTIKDLWDFLYYLTLDFNSIPNILNSKIFSNLSH